MNDLQVDTSTSYLNVCLSHEDTSHLPDGRIPLRNLVKALEEYVGVYGGQGAMRIAIYYKDVDGEIKPLLPEKELTND
jgi:hypothetical protein